jgi:hypothetical protein
MQTDKATIEVLNRRPVVNCKRCGRELTEPDSYASGIGPICAEHWMICQNELARLNLEMNPNLLAATRDDGPSIISLTIKGDRLILKFKFDEDGQVRRQVKVIPGWKFDYDAKQWSVPACGANLDLAIAALPDARIYVGDLERINALPKLPIAPKPTELHPRKAWLDDTSTSPQAILSWDRRDRDFPTILQEVKECPGRRWNPDKFYWTAPPSQQLMAVLDKWGFEVNQPLADYLGQFRPKDVGQLDLPEGLKLYRFQAESVRFLESRRGRAVIAHEMGLGKTVISLSWLRIHPEARPAICVVPASLKINWQREARKWLANNELIQVVSGRPNGNGQKLWGSVIVINYDILKDWVKAIKVLNPQAVVFDESHFLKNPKAQRTQAGKELTKNIPHVIAMSGTPIINRPSEFYNAINLVNPTVFPSWYKYASRYCAPKFNGFATEYTGASHTEELHQILTNPDTGIMHRYLKKDVLKDLPAKIRSVVPLELGNRSEYERAVEDFLGWLEQHETEVAREHLTNEQPLDNEEEIDWAAKRIGKDKADRAAGAEALVAMGKLKQLAARGKLKAAIEWINNVVDQGEKIIIFAVHHWVVDRLMEAFGSQAVRLTGKENQEQRQQAVDRFQTDDSVRVFVGNLQAAGVGITLTAASHVAFMELGWQPGAHQQAEDRAHRIGQEQTVNIYYLVAEDTIEEDIAAMLDAKADVLGQVLDGHKAKESTILGELLKKLKERKDNQKI